MRTRSKRFAAASGLVISGFFLYLAFRDLNLDQFWSTLQSVNILLLLIAVPTYFVALVIIALRWQFLLRAVRLIPLVSLAQLVTICYMGNGVYPLRAGEALRIYLLRRRHHVPLASVTTTVLVERAFDGLVMLAFISISLLFIDIDSPEVDAVIAIASPLFVSAVIVFFVLAARPDLFRFSLRLMRRVLPRRLETVVGQLGEDAITGLAGLRNPAHLAGAVLSSFVTWAIEASVYWIVMFAFSLEHNYAVALLVIGVVNLAGVISASPGQIGVYEFVVSSILVALGTPLALAASYAVVIHLVIWVPTTAVGFALLVREGMGWSEIARARELEQALPG